MSFRSDLFALTVLRLYHDLPSSSLLTTWKSHPQSVSDNRTERCVDEKHPAALLEKKKQQRNENLADTQTHTSWMLCTGSGFIWKQCLWPHHSPIITAGLLLVMHRSTAALWKLLSCRWKSVIKSEFDLVLDAETHEAVFLSYCQTSWPAPSDLFLFSCSDVLQSSWMQLDDGHMWGKLKEDVGKEMIRVFCNGYEEEE